MVAQEQIAKDYPRWVTEKFAPFDPIALGEETERIVCRGTARKYTHFYCTGVYGGISTGYTVGCSLRCIFCWVGWSRDFPERFGEFYSPEGVFTRLVNNAKKKGVRKLRISGGEPTLGKEHLLSLLDLVATTRYRFILETNGILLGQDRDYVWTLKKYKNIHIRVCLKAGHGAGFEKRTGALAQFYELPYRAIAYLQKAGVSFHVASMSESRLMAREERRMMLQQLRQLNYDDFLEEEVADPYPTAVARLKKAGYHSFF